MNFAETNQTYNDSPNRIVQSAFLLDKLILQRKRLISVVFQTARYH